MMYNSTAIYEDSNYRRIGWCHEVRYSTSYVGITRKVARYTRVKTTNSPELRKTGSLKHSKSIEAHRNPSGAGLQARVRWRTGKTKPQHTCMHARNNL